jgi:DNA invertase Pin-like site-specific DNA recombinase
LIARGVKLALGASVYDPADPMGKMFFNILATFAEFEADLIRMRTREGMAIARAKGKLRGKSPKLSDKQQGSIRVRSVRQSVVEFVTLWWRLSWTMASFEGGLRRLTI